MVFRPVKPAAAVNVNLLVAAPVTVKAVRFASVMAASVEFCVVDVALELAVPPTVMFNVPISALVSTRVVETTLVRVKFRTEALAAAAVVKLFVTLTVEPVTLFASVNDVKALEVTVLAAAAP